MGYIQGQSGEEIHYWQQENYNRTIQKKKKKEEKIVMEIYKVTLAKSRQTTNIQDLTT